MTTALNQFTSTYLPQLTRYMDARIAESHDDHLAAAMAYSLDAGGKRLRPLLLLATVAACGGRPEDAVPAAAAVEFVHTYSLIHDDLPAMDNADMRRGRPSNHVQFDEATAILAGDALLTDAFFCLGDVVAPAEVRAALAPRLAAAAGSRGMVAGQQQDIDGSHVEKDVAALTRLNAHKTGALIEAATGMGGLIAEASADETVALGAFARAFGLGFQLKDDILDATSTAAALGKPVSQDDVNDKHTYVALMGLAGARQALAEQASIARTALTKLPGDTQVLAAIADYLDEE